MPPLSSAGSRTSTRIRLFCGVWEGALGVSAGREALIFPKVSIVVHPGEGGWTYVFEFPLLPALLAFAAVPANEFLGGEIGAQRREQASPR